MEENPGEKTTYTILQKRQHDKANGYSCSVQRSTFTIYCGAYSHNKLIQPPAIEVYEELSAHQCNSMVHNGRYISHYGTTHDVDIGETIFTASERGIIKAENGNVRCEGESLKINNEIIDGVLILSQYRVNIAKEDFKIDNNMVEVISDHIILPSECTPDKGACNLINKVYLWKWERKCDFVKIKEIQLTNENGFLVDHSNKLLFSKEDHARLGAPCPSGTLYYTEYSQLYLTDSSEFEFVKELDISMYIKTRSNYANYISEQRTKQNEIIAKTAECKSKFGQIGNEIRKVSGNYYSKRTGDLLLIFECQNKTAKVAENLKECYQQLPIYLDDELHFVSDQNVLIKDGTKTGCANDVFAPSYVTTEGKWITVNPGVKTRSAPATTSVIEYSDTIHEDMSSGGLYTDTEMADWEDMIYWSSFKEATVEHLSQGLCKGSGCYSKGAMSQSIPSYNLDILEKAKEELGLWKKFKKIVEDHFVIVALLIILKFILSIMLTISLLVYSYMKQGIKGAINFAYQVTLPEIYRINKNINKRKRNEQRERVNYNKEYEQVTIQSSQELYPSLKTHNVSPCPSCPSQNT